MSIIYDAPNGNAFEFPVQLTVNSRIQLPIKVDPSALVYIEQFVQRPQFWEPLALDTQHPTHAGAYLVEETNPKLEDSGLFKWLRTYATIPGDRDEFETTSFGFPAYKVDSDSDNTERSQFTQSVVGKVSFSYKLTTDPIADFTIEPIFHPVDASSNKVRFVASDTTPTRTSYEGDVTAGNFIRSKETEISRWRGNIYQAKDFLVVAL